MSFVNSVFDSNDASGLTAYNGWLQISGEGAVRIAGGADVNDEVTTFIGNKFYNNSINSNVNFGTGDGGSDIKLYRTRISDNVWEDNKFQMKRDKYGKYLSSAGFRTDTERTNEYENTDVTSSNNLTCPVSTTVTCPTAKDVLNPVALITTSAGNSTAPVINSDFCWSERNEASVTHFSLTGVPNFYFEYHILTIDGGAYAGEEVKFNIQPSDGARIDITTGAFTDYTVGTTYSITATTHNCTSATFEFTVNEVTNKDCKSDEPTIDIPTEGDDAVTGEGTPGSEVTVTFPDGTLVTTTVDEDGNWEVDVPDGLKLTSGDTVMATQTELGKDPSDEATETVEEEIVPPVIGRCDEARKALENAVIPQIITPNGDGRNDVWSIKELETYMTECVHIANNKVIIFNRWGAKVYEKRNYMSDSERFRGMSENSLDFQDSELLPAGTYFYILKVEGFNDKTGYLYILGEEDM